MVKSQYFKKKIVVLVITIIVIEFFLVIFIFQSPRGKRHLMVSFLDIGQGDSTLIRTPGNHTILIDAGPTGAVVQKLGKALPFYNRTIDLAIITHPQTDHFAGFLDVAERYTIKQLITSDIPYKSPEWEAFTQKVVAQSIPVSFVSSQRAITIEDGVTIELLWPIATAVDTLHLPDANEGSVVALVRYGDHEFLFTGDISADTEAQLLSHNLIPDIDVLKVAHHGSKTSSSEEFIAQAQPEIGVILLGRDNPFGHPNARTLRTLNQAGVVVYRTDTDGDVTIASDGITYAVRTHFIGGF
ncbi:MAG TPA: MBL fold metallo-hydrolase [Patescibacteria group bacterium]|nr:MBL fold metallo-hydrolase [Patescibacteria group bacterium]